MHSAIALIEGGGTQFPICRIPSPNSPANTKPSVKGPNRLNSGSENRRHSLQCMAPYMPRSRSLRRTVRAGFLGSNFAALNPCPVIRLSDDPSRTVSRYLKDRCFPAAGRSASICSGGVEHPTRESPHAIGWLSGPGCSSTGPLALR